MTEKRIGVVGIVLDSNELSMEVNEIMHKHSELIIGRMGLPNKERNVAVIAVIVDGTTDEISALTGKLGKIKGVSVKTALAQK
ncbi:MAG: TM1266 family iron-only hydrogenase system putative regulator [Bacillota bacterium]|jgi:putative iron-only hydrogenase system regulator